MTRQKIEDTMFILSIGALAIFVVSMAAMMAYNDIFGSITTEGYQDIRNMAYEFPELKPMIKEAMESDGVITRPESIRIHREQERLISERTFNSLKKEVE